MKKSFWLICMLVIIIFIIAFTSVAKAQSDSWPMYQGNSSHTGYASVILQPEDFSLKWLRGIGAGKALNPITVADGKVLVSVNIYFNDETSFYVLDEVTGETIWSKNFGPVFSVNPPSYAYGNVYIQTGNHANDTYLWAFNADTGEIVFKSPHSAQWERYYAPTIFDGVVYVNGGGYGGMYAFNAYNGAMLWFTDLPQYDQWTPAVDSNYVYSYVGSYFPALYVADRQTGEILFDIDDQNFNWHGWSVHLAPVLGDNNSIYAIQDGRLIKFNISNTRIDWEFDRNYSGQPSYAKGIVYAISAGMLSAVDAETGDVLWSWNTQSEVLSGSLIVTDSHILVSSSSKTYAVDLNTHTDVWSYPEGGHLSLGKDALYIASHDGTLICIAYNPYTKPVAIAGPDKVEYSNLTLDASQSYDPDGYIASYAWKITHKEDNAYSLNTEGKVVNISNLKQGFYDVILTVTDNDGFYSLDNSLLAVMGPEPQCEYTYDDVIAAYEEGYDKATLENQAIYDSDSRVLYIPSVLVDGNIIEFRMIRDGISHNFKLVEGIQAIE